jgi:hypothetical protein
VRGAVRLVRIVVLMSVDLDRLLSTGGRAEHGSCDRAPDGEQYRKEDQQPDSERSHSS